MDERQQILSKFKEMEDFLNRINLDKMREQYTREELNQLKGDLSGIRLRSLGYELSKITEEMKKEEYPELLGVHRYPVLKEIDFLSEKEKIELDKYLVKFIPGRDFVQTLWRVIREEEKVKKLKVFLLERGVVEERHAVMCPNCSDEHLSRLMTKNEKEELESLVKNYEDYEDYEDYIKNICDECFYEFEPKKWDKLYIKTYLKMMMPRDKSLDNV